MSKKGSLLDKLARAGMDAVTQVIAELIQALPDEIFKDDEKEEKADADPSKPEKKGGKRK